MKRRITHGLLGLGLIFMSEALQAQVPVADFSSCTRVIEQYGIADFTDLSTNSPGTWKWEVSYASGDAISDGIVIPDPNGTGRDEFSQNPQFEFDAKGCFAITLTAGNGSGSSAPVSKTCFIEVLEPYQKTIGFGAFNTTAAFGSVCDDGGPNSSYSNNQGLLSKSYLKIVPYNGHNITLKFKQIRLADDSIFIYDDDTVNNSAVLAALSASNNGTYPAYVSTAGKMFILFKSNGSLKDSGYKASFYTDQDPSKVINTTITTVKNVAGVPSVFVNKQTSILARDYTRLWYVNDTLRPDYTDKDTLKHTFYTDSTYRIAIKVISCSKRDSNIILGNNTTCNAAFIISNAFGGIVQDQSVASPSADYLWEFGDGDTSHAKTPTHIYPGPGKYNLCLTITDGACVSNYCDTIEFDSSGSMRSAFMLKIVDRYGHSTSVNNTLVNTFRIYPNPVSDILRIEAAEPGDYKASVLSISGAVIMETGNTGVVDMSGLATGIYTLKIQNSTGNSAYYKVLKY